MVLVDFQYNIYPVVERQTSANQIQYKHETEMSSLVSIINASSDEYQFKLGNIHPIQPKTIDEIMAPPAIPFPDLSDDQPVDSKHISEASVETSAKDLETNIPSILSISNHDISTEQLENELADVHTKTKNIEDMIDKFLLNI